MLRRQSHHVDSALALLVQQFRGKARLEGVLSALARQVQSLEDTLWDLHLERRPGRATGAQLDGIGRIVGLQRGALADGTYRTHLRARIRLLRSTGTPEEILGMISMVVGPGASIELNEYQRATILLAVRGRLTEATDDDVVALVHAAKPAGVRAIAELSEATGVFTFDSDADDEGFGDVYDHDVGGKFSSARDTGEQMS